MRLLFVCSYVRQRSVTAASFLTLEGHETRAAGCHPNAIRPLTTDDLEWAEVIYVFERNHRNRIRSQWPAIYQRTSIHCLYIADEWEAHDPGLIALIKERMAHIAADR